MTESVKARFPEELRRIDELLETRSSFREVCTDHQELTELLRDRCESTTCEHAREILHDLEDEIMDYLEGKRKLLD